MYIYVHTYTFIYLYVEMNQYHGLIEDFLLFLFLLGLMKLTKGMLNFCDDTEYWLL